ncbi:MAG TPA: hypothetical protein VI007_07930 [bacterium]
MKRLLGALLAMLGLAVAGCETVKVQVPPEADLAGIKTVAVMATDMPGDPTPVAILLRGEASSRIRRLLPALTLVDPIAGPDALLRMTVVRHGTTDPSMRLYVDSRTGRVSCYAWHTASLLVDAAVVTGQTIRWQGILEAGRRIELPCLRRGFVWVPIISPGNYDTTLVGEAVDDLGRRLAGYVRTELRAIKNPPPPPGNPAPDPP